MKPRLNAPCWGTESVKPGPSGLYGADRVMFPTAGDRTLPLSDLSDLPLRDSARFTRASPHQWFPTGLADGFGAAENRYAESS